VFDITFVDPHSENRVQYDMDLPGYHPANPLTLEDGSITITSTGGGGNPCCPALYLWNGREFKLENNILAQCDGARVENDVTDFYLVTGAVVAVADELRFQVRENATSISEFENFQLLVIDHPEDEPIHVTREGAIVTTGQPYQIQWARDHTGRDITELISTPDDVVYQSREDGWFEVSLGTLNDSEGVSFALGEHDSQVKRDCPVARSQGIALDKSRKLKVAIQTANGGWEVISSSDARHIPVRQSTLLDAALIDPDRELILRYSWESHYRIDVLEFSSSAPYEGDIDLPALLGAEHSEVGVIATRLGARSADRVTLEAGETIELVFDAADLPRVAGGFDREYVFVTTGKYEDANLADRTEKPRSFALDANKPNPFNPTTTITYNLPKQTWVELTVYDVSGALVRTLVSGSQPAGEKSVTWEGRSDTGTPMASGVYFYRLKTPEFAKTRKMILLK
jgi:hypothetical protein